MKVALVHDWLTGMRGGEKVLEALCDLFPSAPIYTLVHIQRSVSQKIEAHRIRTSFIQKFPLLKKHYRSYLPLFPWAIERLDLSDFDLIVSSSHCVAKGVVPAPSSVHISYCHTPMRYIWSHFDDYFGDHRTGFVKRQMIRAVAGYLRNWDVSSNQRVDAFVANSKNVASRLRKFYGRESEVIYPPVDVHFFTPSGTSRHDFFLIVSALVPYKRLEVAIDAFRISGRKLRVVGTGPEYASLRASASENIEFLGRVSDEELLELYRTARALIQPNEEDFGINLVEALACECPVIAFSAGGAVETVTDGETGLFFNELSSDLLRQAVDKADGISFNKSLMRASSLRFSPERFKEEFQTLVQRLTTHGLQEK